MAQPPVPPSRRVRPSRAHNIDNDRLLARQAFIVGLANDSFATCGRRRDMVNLSIELFAIENVLDDRGVSYTRRTLTRAQSDAMSTHGGNA